MKEDQSCVGFESKSPPLVSLGIDCPSSIEETFTPQVRASLGRGGSDVQACGGSGYQGGRGERKKKQREVEKRAEESEGRGFWTRLLRKRACKRKRE